jgi:SAM-dependent methyltransferase
MDISWQTCHGARKKYGEVFCAGDAHSIPVRDHSMDVVVSFETIEHIRRPEVFLDECVRVLTPKGVLIVSTPNKEVHRESSEPNPCHCSEMNEDEFLALLTSRFTHVKRYAQVVKTAPWWSPRSLAATHSPWVRMKGGWRVRERLRSLLCPHICGDLTDVDRRYPFGAVLSGDRFLASWLNPYSVHPRSGSARERPWYLVALCHD